LRAAALVLGPIMNEAEIRRVHIGAIAVAHALVGRRRLPPREDGGGNGASGSRERQERGRIIKPMLLGPPVALLLGRLLADSDCGLNTRNPPVFRACPAISDEIRDI
jgi:hypothetical protein